MYHFLYQADGDSHWRGTRALSGETQSIYAGRNAYRSHGRDSVALDGGKEWAGGNNHIQNRCSRNRCNRAESGAETQRQRGAGVLTQPCGSDHCAVLDRSLYQ